MSMRAKERFLRVSTYWWRLLLYAYPPSFRATFGHEMEQVFRVACRDALRRAHLGGLMLFWIRSVADLLATAGRERAVDAPTRQTAASLLVGVYAVALACLSGSIHLRADADVEALLIVVSGAFSCGILCPNRPWRWSMLVGIGIPLALFLSHGSAGSAAVHDHDGPSLLPVFFAVLAGYAGAGVSRITGNRRPEQTVSLSRRR